MATDECDCMNVCYKNMKNKQKEWHHATKYYIITFLAMITLSTPLLLCPSKIFRQRNKKFLLCVGGIFSTI